MLLKTLLLFTLFLPHCQPAFLPFTFFNTVGINPFIKIRWKDTCPGCPGPGVEITFVQTGEIDVACLTLDSECVYKGYFRKEPDIPVTVTRGCPNQDADFIEATFKSYKVQGITFMSQVSNGDTVNPLVATAGQFIADHSDEAPGGGRLRTFDNSSIFARQLAFPTYGFEMDIVIYYDNNYKNNLHSGSDSAAKAQIDAVMAHVQTYYNLADSLGTTIKINVKRTEHLSQDWTATEANLKSLENYADALPASDDSIDAFVLFSYENNMAGTTGIAYLGTTCETPRGGRVSISEWTASNIVTAQTVAHEVAHNLKIDHDFNEDSSGVRDPSNPKTCSIEAAPNNVCTNVNSIMDYDQAVTDKWSCCSRQDFQNYYTMKGVANWCLAEAPAPAVTTVAPTTEASEPPFDQLLVLGIIELVDALAPGLASALSAFIKQQLLITALNLRILQGETI